MKHFVSEWKTCIFCSLSKTRAHKVETTHGWQQFFERLGPSGSRSYGDVYPTWFLPDQSYTQFNQGDLNTAKKVAA